MYSKLLNIVLDLTDQHTAHSIKKHHELVKWIYNSTPKLIDSNSFRYSIQTRCRWILSGRTDFPICKFCHKPFGMNKDIPIRYDYSQWCSNKCRQSDPIVVARTKATKFKNHGDENYCNPEKAKQTFLDHYGVTNPNKCQSVKDKIKSTNLKTYGYECCFQSPKIQEKIRQTCLDKYGYEHFLSVPSIREKGVQTWLEKYGVDCATKSPSVKQKIKQSFIEHYGVDNNMKSAEGFEKWRQAFIAKYGVDNPSRHPEMRLKIRRKYFYDNQYFDSAPEIAFYIWLKDHHIDFVFQPKEPFKYEFNGKQHLYFADFKIDDMYFEIKGDQFFNIAGKMICPYRNKDMNDDDYQQYCSLFEAKHQCMLENDVVLMRSAEYSMFLLYISQTYGKDYLRQFRTNKHE